MFSPWRHKCLQCSAQRLVLHQKLFESDWGRSHQGSLHMASQPLRPRSASTAGSRVSSIAGCAGRGAFRRKQRWDTWWINKGCVFQTHILKMRFTRMVIRKASTSTLKIMYVSRSIPQHLILEMPNSQFWLWQRPWPFHSIYIYIYIYIYISEKLALASLWNIYWFYHQPIVSIHDCDRKKNMLIPQSCFVAWTIASTCRPCDFGSILDRLALVASGVWLGHRIFGFDMLDLLCHLTLATFVTLFII